MAGTSGTSSQAISLRAKLAEDPYRFDFFQALRMLDAANPQMPRIGTAMRAADEAVRLGQDVSLAFPTSMLASYEAGDGQRKDRMEVKFFGMFGPNGPMPLHITEYVFERILHEKDLAFKDFANVFHHRMLSLFYRAWANAQPSVSADRPEDDGFLDLLADVIGIGLPGARNYQGVSDHSKVHYAGLLSMQQRPALALSALVQDYLQVPTQVEQFFGEWLTLPDECLNSLGGDEAVATLGSNVFVGGRVWQTQSRFRLVCGPMGFDRFRRLLPECDSLQGLAAIVRQFTGDGLRFWSRRS